MSETTDRFADERRDLLEALAFQRAMLLGAAEGLDEEQARATSTVSELSVGGLIKHVANVERKWAVFVTEGAAAFEWSGTEEEKYAEWAAAFVLTDEETLAGAIADYEAVAARTDELIATVDLDSAHPLPEARGSPRVLSAARVVPSPTSWPRPPSTPAMPTSSERRSTARSRWADPDSPSPNGRNSGREAAVR